MPAGGDMNTGMGMLTGVPGAPSGEDYGPALGRGLGVGSDSERTVGNTPLSSNESMHGMNHGSMRMTADVAPNANQIPGFPQDAFMEGPMMAMDDMVKKPETYGLPPGWSGFMQGMMTLVRVLHPDQYDHIMQLKQHGPMAMPGMHNHRK
jgi:hypothetical protein